MTRHPIDSLEQANAVTSEVWRSRPKYLVAGTGEGFAHWVYLRCRPDVSDGELIDEVIAYASEAAVCGAEFDSELRVGVDRSEHERARVDPLGRELGSAVARLRSSPRRWRAYVRFCDLALSTNPRIFSNAWSAKSRLETGQLVCDLTDVAAVLPSYLSVSDRQLADSWPEVREKMLTLDALMNDRGFAASQHSPTERIAIALVVDLLRAPDMQACSRHWLMLEHIRRPLGKRAVRQSSATEPSIPRRAMRHV